VGSSKNMREIMYNVDSLFSSASSNYKIQEFHLFKIAGAPRWMIDAGEHFPWHLKTWNTTTYRSKLVKLFLILFWYMRLPLLSEKVVVQVHEGSLFEEIISQFQNIGIFIGTPGLNRKIILYCKDKDKGWFIKVPCNVNSAALVDNELRALKRLSVNADTRKIIPRFKLFEGALVTEDVSNRYVNFSTSILDACCVDSTLYSNSGRKARILDVEFLENAFSVDCNKFRRTELISLLKSVKLYMHTLGSPERQICIYDAHGDLTKWNMFKSRSGAITVIDWEMYGEKTKYFDLIHYVISYEILVKKTSNISVLKILWRQLEPYMKLADFELYVGLYLVQQSLYYAEKYEQQEYLHTQAFWQVKAWEHLINELSIKG
jgi:hypothetical protein